MSEHRITVTTVDDGGANFSITHCPEDDACAVWHECAVEGCEPPEDVWEAEDGDHVRHGAVHRYIEYGWMTRDEPHNCGLRYADEWDGLDEVGKYACDVDYLGDGSWWPIGITKIEEAKTDG